MKKLNPYYVTGFVEGEGSFYVTVYKRKDRNNSFGVQFGFSIGLAERDLPLLKKIKAFFGVGFTSIRKNKQNRDAVYQIQGTNYIQDVIVKHFDKYLLRGNKKESYKLYKKCLRIWKGNKDRSIKLKEIYRIKQKMNPKARKKPLKWVGEILA